MSEEIKEKHQIKDMFGETRTVSDVEEYNETISKEILEWSALLPGSGEIQGIIARLQKCKITISPKIPTTNNAWFLRELKAKEKDLNTVFFANSPVFAEISMMLPLGNEIISGFINYLYTKAVTIHVRNINQLTTFNLEGPIRAIQFLSNNINIIKSDSSNKAALEKLRLEYLQKIESIEKTAGKMLAEFKSTKQQLESEWKLQFDLLQETEKSELTEFKKIETEFFKSFENNQKELEKIYKRNLNAEVGELKRLEDLYSEKLKLEEPAKFWKEKEETHKRNGRISLGILLVLTFASLGFLVWHRKGRHIGYAASAAV